MPRINLANASAGIRNASGPGGQLRAKDQLSAVVDGMLQIVGNSNIVGGSTELADPLNSPFTIYVDPQIGSDFFVGGSYNSYEEPSNASDPAKKAAKLKRMESQRLTCGYSIQRPFRTINRAIIEVIIATSKSYLSAQDEANVECPAIELATGTHIVYNEPGNDPGAIPISEWPAAGFDPTPGHLMAFNPSSGGVVIPRHATLSHGLGLRQCIIRPSWVPLPADEAADYSNRAAILKLSSSCNCYGLSFRDKEGATSSHHLLDCFHSASQADLEQLYAKVRTAVGSTANISAILATARPVEWQIIGAFTGNPSATWDSAKGGGSPTILNCTLRSEYGMGGVYWDGARVEGLKSLAVFKFNGTSLQRDLSCWEIYSEGVWMQPPNYQSLIDSGSDSVRMKPRRASRHITLRNEAAAQVLSSQVTGAGRHFLAESGAQLECSNCGSSFGGVAAVAQGYQATSFPMDSTWILRRIRVARSVADQTGNVIQINLGTVAAISGSTITLQAPLVSSADPLIPEVLASRGYTLPASTLIWVDNPNGVDWRATLASNAWSSADATRINITSQALQAGTSAPIGTGSGGVSLAIGQRVYIRRLVDTRTPAQRRVSLKLSSMAAARIPLRQCILQTRPSAPNSGINRALAPGGAEVLEVTRSVGILPEGAGTTVAAEITIRQACPDQTYAAGVLYRLGQTVKSANKHFTARSTFVSIGAAPDPARWQESYVSMESSYDAEDPVWLEGPVLIFDLDTDSNSDATATCGIDWTSIYTASQSFGVREQLRNASDYRGALALLRALGFLETVAHDSLVPRTEASRDRDPASATDFPNPPGFGAATGRANWALEFRRPSLVQLLGHRFNAVGYWNYSRALPQVRQPLTPLNEFNAFFAAVQGGRIELRGSTPDGFDVSQQGLFSTDTGEQITISAIGIPASGLPS
jgi:hypothetical protein